MQSSIQEKNNTKISIGLNSNSALPLAETRFNTNSEIKLNNINDATWSENSDPLNIPLNTKIQVLLNRNLASTGPIDGNLGLNTVKAISAFQIINGLTATGQMDKTLWMLLTKDTKDPVFIEYQITANDLKYSYIDNIPLDYAKQAKMKNLNYVRITEMLAERFSMDEFFLQKLNPQHKFNRVGEKIIVANMQRKPIHNVHSLVAHKGMKQLFLFNANNKLIAAFPVTIGSDDNPSPTGTHKINSIVRNPYYSYSPKNFIQGKNLQALTLPPGPNNPVGSVWIGLSKPSFGIHGSPSPSLISKSSSHGCIRLTNWDVEYLAKILNTGTSIKFVE